MIIFIPNVFSTRIACVMLLALLLEGTRVLGLVPSSGVSPEWSEIQIRCTWCGCCSLVRNMMGNTKAALIFQRRGPSWVFPGSDGN